jgi:hypothetical protein
MIFSANSWKKLAELAAMEPTSSWQMVADDLGLSRSHALRLMVALQEAKLELLGATGQDDEVFQVWNLGEWCQLVHILEEQVKDESNPEMKKMALPLLKQCRQHPAYSVYTHLRQACSNPVEKSFQVLAHDSAMEKKIAILEESILKHETVIIERVDHRSIDVIPCKLIHLEGQMTLIAEETHDHCLFAILLGDMDEVQSTGERKLSRSVGHEISEFVHALRSMGEGEETRLILKIKDPEKFTLRPDYEFLGKPCFVTNPDGDLIWAAYVEPSEELFEWLAEVNDHVEILDPPHFMADYAAYCEEKSRKLA